MAPEILRKPDHYSALPFEMQCADVYAFAIIVFEICGRRGPFGTLHNQYTNEG